MPKLLTTRDLVEMGIFTTTAAAGEARYRGTGPKFLKLAEGRTGRIRYRETDVMEWLESCERTSTADDAA